MSRQQAEMAISLMSRAQLEQLLNAHSIQCYDSEGTEVLREAALVNLRDGTISPMELTHV